MDYLSICIFISLVERRMQPLVSTILKLYRKCVRVRVCAGVGGGCREDISMLQYRKGKLFFLLPFYLILFFICE